MGSMLVIPYRHVRLRVPLTKPEAEEAILGLVDGPPDWLASVAPPLPSYRLRGTVDSDGFRLVVVRKPWHRSTYLPVITGHVVGRGRESVISLTFRPRWYDALFLPVWSVLVLGTGGPLLLGAGFPLAFHLVACWIAFTPEVDRVVALLETKLEATDHDSG
jgi:hypothetical protein